MKRTKHNQGTILTIDPSITAWGWVVVDTQGVVIAADCIKTAPTNKKMRIRKSDDTVRRISEINHLLLQVIKKYNVILILSELPHGSQSAVAAKMIGAVSAMGQSMSDFLDIGIEWYSEGDCKMSVLRKRSAAKQEMINAIDNLYVVDWFGIKYKDEAIADALAVHHVAMQQSSALKLLKN